MTKPMTTEKLFNKIYDILKEKDKIPDILEYGHAAGSPVPITTYEYELGSKLAYGGNEGIYLDIWMERSRHNEKQRIGIFKTLYENSDAMHMMARLLADFIIEEHAYVNAHLDDFTWEGVDVYALNQDGQRYGWGYTCCDMEDALYRKDELLKKYQQVIVRENATRKEKIFNQSKEVLNNEKIRLQNSTI